MNPGRLSKQTCMLLILVVALPVVQAMGADDHDRTDAYSPVFWEVSGHYGFIWAHTRAIDHLAQKHFPLFQLSAWQPLTGQRPWHHLYAFPDVGLGFWGGSLGYPDVLGQAYALTTQLRIPLLSGASTRLFIQHGVGLGYVTRPFDRLNNFRSNAIGSHLNIAFQTGVKLNVHAGRHASVSLGIGLAHFSNGAFKKPNRGLNIPTASLSLALPEKRTPDHRKPDPVPLLPGWRNKTFVSFYMGGGVNRYDHRDQTRYRALFISSTITYMISPKHRIGIGGDIFHNQADRLYVDALTMELMQADQVMKGGLHLAYKQLFGELDLVFQTGYYLFHGQKEHGMIYNRLGFRYPVRDQVLLGLSLKTHTFTAEYLEVGIGYRLKARN